MSWSLAFRVRQTLKGSLWVLPLIGGVVGLVLGVIGVWLLCASGKTPAVISWQAVGFSVVFSVAVGILFGVYPARRAAWLSPVEALRTE